MTNKQCVAVCLVSGLILAAAVSTKSAGAAEESVEEQNRRTIQAAFNKWRSGTGNVFDLLARDATWTIVGHSAASKTYLTKQDFIDTVIMPFNARLSSRLVPTVRGIYADGDMVIVLFDGAATARDGNPYQNTYTWYLQMREGRIVQAIAFYDSISFNDLWTRVKPVIESDGRTP